MIHTGTLQWTNKNIQLLTCCFSSMSTQIDRIMRPGTVYYILLYCRYPLNQRGIPNWIHTTYRALNWYIHVDRIISVKQVYKLLCSPLSTAFLWCENRVADYKRLAGEAPAPACKSLADHLPYDFRIWKTLSIMGFTAALPPFFSELAFLLYSHCLTGISYNRLKDHAVPSRES